MDAPPPAIAVDATPTKRAVIEFTVGVSGRVLVGVHAFEAVNASAEAIAAAREALASREALSSRQAAEREIMSRCTRRRRG